MALIMASLIGLLEIISILVVRHEVSTARKFYEGKSYGEDMVNHLDEYLMETPEGEEMTRLEAIGNVMGTRMFEATRFSAMQSKSVDARTQNRYDSKVREAIQDKMPPQYKILRRVAEEIGFNFDDILMANEVVPFMNSLKKHGMTDIFRNNGPSSGGTM